MRVLVNQLEIEEFEKIRDMFLKEDEVVFVEYDNNFEHANDFCENPFYVEENIEDLPALLDLLELTDYNESDQTKRPDWDWDIYYGFRDFIYEVFKQREIGRPVSNLEFILEKLQGDYDIFIDYAFDPEELDESEDNYLVLYGKSKLGEMNLYEDGSLLVFEVIYPEETPLFKIPTEGYVYWHPYDLFDAIEDVIRFMDGDEQLIPEKMKQEEEYNSMIDDEDED